MKKAAPINMTYFGVRIVVESGEKKTLLNHTNPAAKDAQKKGGSIKQ
jgi:hypothetical protein